MDLAENQRVGDVLAMLLLVVVGFVVVIGGNAVYDEFVSPDPVYSFEFVNLTTESGEVISTSKSQMLGEILINQGAILDNQRSAKEALELNELGRSGCVISNSFPVDVNTVGVSLLCPVPQNVG